MMRVVVELCLFLWAERVSASEDEYWTAFIDVSYEDSGVLHTETSETGQYSTWKSLPVDGVAGELISSSGNESRKGCEPPFLPGHSMKDWIAVVERGDCLFNTKIQNAISEGASGVLVYDDKSSAHLESMKVREDLRIPSVFTFRWKGLQLLRLMRRVPVVHLSFRRGSRCLSSRNKSAPYLCTPVGVPWQVNRFNSSSGTFNLEKRTSVIFVCVSFALTIISLAWLVFYYVQRFRYKHAKDRLERRLRSRAKRALALIPTSLVKKEDLKTLQDEDSCPVCIENYEISDVLRILPCKHTFHKACVDQWLLDKRTCPMCKMNILKYYGLVSENSNDPLRNAVTDA